VITIRKIGGLVILIFFFLGSVEAADERYGFSLSSNIGFLYGQAEEIVYKYPKEDSYLSELLWDLKPLVYAGLGADFGPMDTSRNRGFTAALSFKAGLPLKTGIIEDRDWLNSDPKYDYLTWYSRHDAYSKTALLLDVSAGYFWRFAGSLSLSVFGEFSWMHFSWSAMDGYLQYSSKNSNNYYQEWDDSIPKTYKTGELLRYKQDWFIFSPGVSLNWDINGFFSLKGLFNYSPLIYCADRDDHLIGDKTYFDYLYFGHYIKYGGEFIFSPSRNTDISLFALSKHITGTRGDIVHQARRYNDEAGAGLSTLDLGLTVKFRLTDRN